MGTKFDRVLFDSPPAGVVTDAIILAKELDGAVFVVKAFKTAKPAVERTLESIREVGGDDLLVIPENSALGGEDFSFYTEKVPCAFWWLGCHDPELPFYPIHSGGFFADERALPYGMEVMVKSALKFLAE